MRLCTADALSRVNAATLTVDDLRRASDLCYAHMHGQGLLNDFKIRRLKFTQQTYDERILLWMVVVITLSGVFLAGMQLFASFKLASTGSSTSGFDQQTELTVEQGKLSVKSSLTGLLILICSFAFFWVFVYEIFVIKPVNVDGEAANHTTAQTNAQVSTGLLQPQISPALVSSSPKR